MIEGLQGTETLVLSALRYMPSEVHFSIDEAIEFAEKVGATRTFLTHISHDLEHDETNQKLPENIRLAHDGLEVPFQPMTEEIKEFETALLIGFYLNKKEESASVESLDELERLSETYGLKTIDKVPCHLRKITAATILGKGKLEEITGLAEEYNVSVIIFDDEITPYQGRNLEKVFKRPVLDRTELIIEVFAQRAQTKEARLQIELAKSAISSPDSKDSGHTFLDRWQEALVICVGQGRSRSSSIEECFDLVCPV